MAHRQNIHYHTGGGGGPWMWIVLLVAVGALAYTALTPRSVGGGPGGGPGGGGGGANSCNFQPQAALPDVGYGYSYPLQTSSGTPTPVAVAVNTFAYGQSAIIGAKATSATALVHINGTGLIPCPSTLFIVFGSGAGGSYPGMGVVVPINKSGTTVNFQNGQLQAAVLAPTFSNGTSFSTNQVSSGIPVAGPTGVATAGSSYTFTVYSNPGQGTYGGGQVYSGTAQPNGGVSLNPQFGGYCIFAYSNTVAVPLGNENIAPNLGPCPYVFTTPSIVPSGFGVRGWLEPAVLNYTIGSIKLSYTATLGANFGGNTAVGFFEKDVDPYQQAGYGGSLNTPQGFLSFQLQNPNTGTALGYPTVNALFPVNSFTMTVPGFGANSLGGNIKFCGSAGCS